MKTNASEPLMMCRKRRNEIETGTESLARDERGAGARAAHAVSGMEAA
jgi:hypothetical protein